MQQDNTANAFCFSSNTAPAMGPHSFEIERHGQPTGDLCCHDEEIHFVEKMDPLHAYRYTEYDQVDKLPVFTLCSSKTISTTSRCPCLMLVLSLLISSKYCQVPTAFSNLCCFCFAKVLERPLAGHVAVNYSKMAPGEQATETEPQPEEQVVKRKRR